MLEKWTEKNSVLAEYLNHKWSNLNFKKLPSVEKVGAHRSRSQIIHLPFTSSGGRGEVGVQDWKEKEQWGL
jgi:hypothetical protein